MQQKPTAPPIKIIYMNFINFSIIRQSSRTVKPIQLNAESIILPYKIIRKTYLLRTIHIKSISYAYIYTKLSLFTNMRPSTESWHTTHPLKANTNSTIRES
jgi:hypothetical protein